VCKPPSGGFIFAQHCITIWSDYTYFIDIVIIEISM